MKLTESALRNIIKQELKNMLSETKSFQFPKRIPRYFKRAEVEATPEEYDSASWSGSAGSDVWEENGKYYKMAVVPATKEEYENASWSGSAGSDVWKRNYRQ